MFFFIGKVWRWWWFDAVNILGDSLVSVGVRCFDGSSHFVQRTAELGRNLVLAHVVYGSTLYQMATYLIRKLKLIRLSKEKCVVIRILLKDMQETNIGANGENKAILSIIFTHFTCMSLDPVDDFEI